MRLFFYAQAPVVAGPEVQTVVAARQTLDQFFNLQIEAIPPSMLQSASGVAIFPNMVKGGFIFGVNYGKGVLACTEPGSVMEPSCYGNHGWWEYWFSSRCAGS